MKKYSKTDIKFLKLMIIAFVKSLGFLAAWLVVVYIIATMITNQLSQVYGKLFVGIIVMAFATIVSAFCKMKHNNLIDRWFGEAYDKWEKEATQSN